MLTRSEADDLLRKVKEYTQAWEAYVSDVDANRPSRYGSGSLVKERQEDLERFLKSIS
jgi:hypothetical protein